MEDIVLFTWLAVIIIVGVVQKRNKEKKDAENHIPSPKEVLEDMFPEIKNEKAEAKHKHAPAAVKPVISPKRTEKKKHSTHVPVGKTPTPVFSAPSEKKSKIKISSRQEARRAFIYSEIFHRKY